MKKIKIAKLQKRDANSFAVSRKMHHIFPVKRVLDHGIFLLNDGKYSKTYTFLDVDYFDKSEAEQTDTILKYAALLNSLQARMQLTFINREIDQKLLNQKLLVTGEDALSESRNSIVSEKVSQGLRNMSQSKYITITLMEPHMTDEKAVMRFISIEQTLNKFCENLKTRLLPCDTKERVHMLASTVLGVKESDIHFDITAYKKRKQDLRSEFLPALVKEKADVLQISAKGQSRYAKCFFLQNYASTFNDRFFKEMMDHQYEMVLTFMVEPIVKSASMQLVETAMDKVLDKEYKIKMRRKRKAEENIPLPRRIVDELNGVASVREAILENNEQLFLSDISMIIFNKDKDQLQESINSVLATAAGYQNEFILAHFRQMDSFLSTIPYGARYTENMRTLLTQEVAINIPFRSCEIQEKEGQFYGINRQSKQYILGNRKLLNNANGLVIGPSGGGKSMNVKLEQNEILLSTQDEVIIIDPQNEYDRFVKAHSGTTIDLSLHSRNFFNPFDIANIDEGQKVISYEKTQMAISMFQEALQKDLSPMEITVIDDAIRDMYEMYFSSPVSVPTLKDLYQLIAQNPHGEELAEELKPYVLGSFSLFSMHTNIDTSNRVVSYGLSNLVDALWGMAMVVLLQTIKKRIMLNYMNNKLEEERAKHTGEAFQKKYIWVYIDELEILLKHKKTALYFISWWKEVRKFHAVCTGIIQDISKVEGVDDVLALLTNSEFVLLTKQDSSHEELLISAGCSEQEVKYLTNSCGKGEGLLMYGNAKVRFDNRIPQDNLIYELINTD